MVERLARCGQRSVTALVDISNYVMFEFGRPVAHLRPRQDPRRARGALGHGRARSLKLLNGNTVEVDETVGVIADAQAVESLAGIMGGDATAVSDDTRNVYVEAAFWWPEAVAGRSRRFNFTTDAGHRFERGVDPGADGRAHRAHHAADPARSAAAKPGRSTTRCSSCRERKPVTLRVARAAKVIGMPVTQAQCADVLRRLGFAVHAGRRARSRSRRRAGASTCRSRKT